MWVVTLNYAVALDDEALLALSERVEAADPDAAIVHVPGGGVDVTVWEDAADPLGAADLARSFVSRFLTDAARVIEIVDEAEYHARADQPAPAFSLSDPEDTEAGSMSTERQRTGAGWTRSAADTVSRIWNRLTERSRQLSR